MVANAGAAALADDVRATVLTCGLESHVRGFKCCFVVRSYELAFLTCCAVAPVRSSLRFEIFNHQCREVILRDLLPLGIGTVSKIEVERRGVEFQICSSQCNFLGCGAQLLLVMKTVAQCARFFNFVRCETCRCPPL